LHRKPPPEPLELGAEQPRLAQPALLEQLETQQPERVRERWVQR
jgi:hypothetical protein